MSDQVGVKRVTIADVCPGLDDTVIIGVIIASQSPRMITVKKGALSDSVPFATSFIIFVQSALFFISSFALPLKICLKEVYGTSPSETLKLISLMRLCGGLLHSLKVVLMTFTLGASVSV